MTSKIGIKNKKFHNFAENYFLMSSIIEVAGLVYEYPNFRALHEVSFSIEEGSVTALVGPNGAGKTTLMRCIAALTRPLIGEIRVCGINTVENPRAVHQKMGYLSDFFGLYDDLTAYQSLQFAANSKGVPEHQVEQYIQEIVQTLQMEELLNKKTKGMSRGQRQKVGIAMTIIHKPTLVLLDEPASGLDPLARHQLSQTILTLANQGITFIISSHILTELQDYSTHMLMIDKGRIIAHKPITAQAHTKRMILKLANPLPIETLRDALANVPHILLDTLEQDNNPNSFFFHYAGSEKEQKSLLMQIIQQQIPVAELAESKVNLQDEFLKSLS